MWLVVVRIHGENYVKEGLSFDEVEEAADRVIAIAQRNYPNKVFEPQFYLIASKGRPVPTPNGFEEIP